MRSRTSRQTNQAPGSEPLPRSGVVADVDVVQLLRTLHKQGSTGVLTFENSRSGGRKLYFMNGDLVAATTDVEDLRLGRFLYRSGHIDRLQLDDALLTSTPEHTVGEVLVEKGFITAELRQEALSAQFREIVFSTFLVRDGTFVWTPEDAIFADNLQLFVDTEALITEGARLAGEIAILSRELEHEDHVYQRATTKSTRAPGREQAELLRHIDGNRSTAELFVLSPLERLPTIQLLSKLLEQGLIRKVSAVPRQAPEEIPTYPLLPDEVRAASEPVAHGAAEAAADRADDGHAPAPDHAATEPDDEDVESATVADESMPRPFGRRPTHPDEGVFTSAQSVLDIVDLSHIRQYGVATDIPLDGIVEAAGAEDDEHHLAYEADEHGEEEHEAFDEDDAFRTPVEHEADAAHAVEEHEVDDHHDGYDVDARAGHETHETYDDVEELSGSDVVEELHVEHDDVYELDHEAAEALEGEHGELEELVGDQDVEELHAEDAEDEEVLHVEHGGPYDVEQLEAESVEAGDDSASFRGHDAVMRGRFPAVNEDDREIEVEDISVGTSAQRLEDEVWGPTESLLDAPTGEELQDALDDDGAEDYEALPLSSIVDIPPPRAHDDELEELRPEDVAAVHVVDEEPLPLEEALFPPQPTRWEPPPARDDIGSDGDEEVHELGADAVLAARDEAEDPDELAETVSLRATDPMIRQVVEEPLLSAPIQLSDLRRREPKEATAEEISKEDMAVLEKIVAIFQPRDEEASSTSSSRRGARATAPDRTRGLTGVQLSSRQRVLLLERADIYNQIFSIVFTQFAGKLGRERTRQRFQDFFTPGNTTYPELFVDLTFRQDGTLDPDLIIRNLEVYPTQRPAEVFDASLNELFYFLLRDIHQILDPAEQSQMMDSVLQVRNLLFKKNAAAR